jgi:hypothetical protein
VRGARRRRLRLAFRLVSFMALGVLLPPGLLVALRTIPALFFATSSFLSRLRLLRLRLGPLPLMSSTSLPATPSTAGFGFAALRALLTAPRSVFVSGALPAPAPLFATSSALRFATTRALRLFVAPTPLFRAPRALRLFVSCAPLFRAFGPLMSMPPAPLPAGFRVGAGDRDVGQGKRTADGDRPALPASVS